MVPLAMGRAARLFSGDQRRAMVARDGGCRGPCCDAGPDETESHHLKEWVATKAPPIWRTARCSAADTATASYTKAA